MSQSTPYSTEKIARLEKAQEQKKEEPPVATTGAF
jgi:hypothetical protein